MKNLLKLGLCLFSFLPFSLTAAPMTEYQHPRNVAYFYFICDSTGADLNDATRLACLDSECINLGLRVEVIQSHLVAQGESCSIVKTETLDTWDASTQTIGAYVEASDRAPVIGVMDVPASARFYGTDSFKVKYPKLGSYVLNLTRSRAAFSIFPVPAS